ncbi:MAG TPA: ABC transporter ATP-binding protein [Longimicrobiales bacterium]
MIHFDGVSKRFGAPGGPASGRVDALADVSLEIPPGGVWGVVGPNGAGKTTLFGLLLGFIHPTTGTVRIRGLEPRRYVRRHGAAYLPERFRLPGEWRVRTALRALARLEGLDRAAAARRVDALIERMGLTAYADREVRTLSRGLNQRLGLAQALLAERELVVLDEPTEGLDPLWRVRFRAIVAELRDAGRTVLIASHDLAEVERLASRVVLLEAGRLRSVIEMDAPPGSAGATYRLELAASVPELAEVFPDAEPIEGDAPAAYRVVVADAAELSRRLAALLEAGAVVASVQPLLEPLEARVRRELGAEGDA